MRIVVIGGAGNFGARIARELRAHPGVELLVARRTEATGRGVESLPSVALDIDSPGLANRLRELAPGLVIHCVGPFQGQDYRVANAALAAGAHYLDLSDGREFVSGFPSQVAPGAMAANRVAITGASTLPAISWAVVESLRANLATLESIEVIIAPGQRAPRGRATLAAVFSYLGRPFPVLRNGNWRRTWGWMDLRSVRLDIGRRFAAACDVPDLALFPAEIPEARTVTFHAALEFRSQHVALWMLAALRRIGLPFRVGSWAASLDRLAGLYDGVAREKGGMLVRVIGTLAGGKRVRRTWQLTVPALNGPEIPCIPAILLARRFAAGEKFRPGAYACMGFLKLNEFAAEFERCGITTRIDEAPA